MVRWMSGVSLKDRRSSEELRRGLGIVSVDRIVRRGRLRWFGHVERTCKETDDWVSKCRILEGVGGVRKGRGRKTWMECVKKDMKECGLKKAPPIHSMPPLLHFFPLLPSSNPIPFPSISSSVTEGKR